MNLNSSPSPFPMHHENDHHYLPFNPNQSSPSSLSCHFFFNSTQDNTGSSFYDHPQFNFQPHHNSDEKYEYQGGSTYEIKNKVDGGLKLTLWKKEDHEGHNSNKWMSSKMRVMQKMKKEDPKLQRSSSSETDQMSSNSSSYNNNSTPIRVCSDCNTTKTPLWRSGPKGPKSLCNACGIRQRKARRAMAAAAAAASGTPAATIDHHQTVKIKVQHKEKKNGHSSQLKKRLKTAEGAVGSPSNGQKKIGFEDFLINISNNLAFHRVFPEDEKDAAILLMALSSGLVNG